jgi:hypothetical protein
MQMKARSMPNARKFSLFLAVAACLCTSPARADAGFVDQVERLEVERGEAEIESQTIFVPSQKRFSSSLRGGLTLEYGLSDRLSLGTEFEYEADDGAFDADEIAVQAKWIALDPATATVGFGVQLGAGYAFEDSALGLEATAIAAIDRADWWAALNTTMRTRPGDRSALDVVYAARADRALTDSVALGIEAGGALAADDPRGHWAGPVLSFGDDSKAALPEVEIGMFAGLNRNSPGVQFRLELDWAF